jgi:hypothetical protein
MRISRRSFVQIVGATCAASCCASRSMATDAAELPPNVRQLTQGPKYHWFGYYDKLQFDPTGRYLLCMEVDFEHRSPTPDDVIRIGMLDLQDGNRWIELGASRAWCWQQGCMLQWLPGSASEIIWNDRDGDHYVAHVLDVHTRQRRTLPHPIYALSPDGKWAIAPDFGRLADMRPGYGYCGVPDLAREELAPATTGIFRVDLATGRQDLVISIADIARIPFAGSDYAGAKHWFNHLLVNPDGSRFVFLHRWPVGTSRRTRMISARPDGSDVRVLIGSGCVSHFIWRDPTHMLAYSKPDAHADDSSPWGFFLYEDEPGGTAEHIGKDIMTGDGHCNYLPDRRWIVNDTYPDQDSKQHLYLFDTRKQVKIELGAFFQPREYWTTSPQHEWRVDLHPRISPDGRCVTIDSPCGGDGRQVYLVDVSAILTSKT